jgi:basic amino acid/polyamine antiporter, APA family
LVYGMARQEVLPPFLGRVHPGRRTPSTAIAFTTVLAFGLIVYVTQTSSDAVSTLGGTTALLLLGVFTIVNVACLVLRRDAVGHHHFRAPTALPVVGALTCAFFVTPFTDRDTQQYEVAGLLLVIGVVLWAITWSSNRALRAKRTYVRDPDDLAG